MQNYDLTEPTLSTILKEIQLLRQEVKTLNGTVKSVRENVDVLSHNQVILAEQQDEVKRLLRTVLHTRAVLNGATLVQE